MKPHDARGRGVTPFARCTHDADLDAQLPVKGCRASGSRGFTLIELLITMLVAAILLGIAVPSFRSFVQNSRLTTQAEALVYDLNLAREEAVKLDTPVEVCASSDGATCNGGPWASGAIVCYPVADCAGGGPAPTLLEVSPGLSGGNTVTEEVSAATAVTYSSNGETGASYQFVFCDSRGPTFGQDVEVNLAGRIEAATSQGQNLSGAALGAC